MCLESFPLEVAYTRGDAEMVYKLYPDVLYLEDAEILDDLFFKCKYFNWVWNVILLKQGWRF